MTEQQIQNSAQNPAQNSNDDVLSLDSHSQSDFSGFASDEVMEVESCKKSKKGDKTLKSVVQKVPVKTTKSKKKVSLSGKQKKGKSKTCKSSDNQSCMVQIDLNNLTNGNIALLKNKLGLSQTESNINRIPQSANVDDEFYYNDYEDNELESVDINTAPNLHVQVQNDNTDSENDSIGINASNKTPRVKNLSKKLMSDLFGDSEKENESDSEWKLPKIKKKSKGSPVPKSLSNLVNTACTSPCDTEAIIEKYNIPENCERLFPPSVNVEIWKILDKRARTYDRVFQDIQNSLAAGIVPILKMVQMLKNHLSGNEEVKQLISDSLTMFGQVHYSLSIRRRYLLRPNINKKYRNLCNVSTPITSLLFGDDISKEMKNCDTGLSLGSNLRSYQPYNSAYGNPREFNRGRGRYPRNFNRGRGRFMPYTHYGQAQFNARGYGAGGPFRGQRRPYRPSATVSSAPN